METFITVAAIILAISWWPIFLTLVVIYRRVHRTSRGGFWDRTLGLLGYAFLGFLLFMGVVLFIDGLTSWRDDCEWVVGVPGVFCD